MTIPKLTFLPCLQAWSHTDHILSLRLLVSPTGNPLEGILPGLPAFVDATLTFRVFVSDSLTTLPMRTNVTNTFDVPARPAIDSRLIFEEIKQSLNIPDGLSGETFVSHSPIAGKQLHKYLPKSYRQQFDFVKPRTSLAVVDDTYHCLMKCPAEGLTQTSPPPPIGWGEVIAFCLRRPLLAEKLGLIIPIDVTIDPPTLLQSGGWLWIEVSDGSYQSQVGTQDFQRSFATRVPELPLNGTRSIFTPVVFPVSDNAAAAAALGQTDRVFSEAIRFDDGFSKIVHVRQPKSIDVLDEEGTSPRPARDEGVQIAWDDEDVLEGQNRVLGPAPDGQNNVVAPRSVFGYRVDVRRQGDNAWTSLSRVQSRPYQGINPGPEERWLEVHPSEVDDQLWLPPWFANWRGGSIVMETREDELLMNVPPSVDSLFDEEEPIDLNDIHLRYGQRYEFRVRLADTTGGGPDLSDVSVREGEAPVALLHMKRHVPPRPPSVLPANMPANGALPKIEIRRPSIGYPAAFFASDPVDLPNVRNQLLTQASVYVADPVNASPPVIPDPDAVFLRIRVLLRSPTFDPDASSLGWTEWYTTTRPFPEDSQQLIDLTLDWHSDVADYRIIDVSSQSGTEGLVTGPLPLIKSRDIRIEFSAIGRNDLSYFATQNARNGDVEIVELHAIAESETSPIVVLPDQQKLRSVFLRENPIGPRSTLSARVAQSDPSTVLVDRLAIATELVADNAMLLGREGDRVAFGCAGLTHYAAPDLSSLEFAEPGELAGQWINVLQLVINRDWTWRGQGSPTVVVRRRMVLLDSPSASSRSWVELGQIQLMNTINLQARKNSNRSYTRMIFIDAFTPPLQAGLPYEAMVEYEMELLFEDGTSSAKQSVTTNLPVATRPIQVPIVRAAGIALTEYKPTEDYSATFTRSKRLWLEFDQPLVDKRDAYFVRVIHRTPDPMLLPDWEPARDPDILEEVPLDPELARIITPGQVQDLSGLDAMQQLEPASNSDRHFLVPLPPNTGSNSPELFSFYTYEIRVGHGPGTTDNPFWSTAQARYGEALTLEGVQHPLPQLTCSVTVIVSPENFRSIEVRAPFAMPYVGLKKVISSIPNTKIWFVLYARLLQADGASWRNVQIGLQSSTVVRDNDGPNALAREAKVVWTSENISSALESVGLQPDTPLSVLAVETLPEPNTKFTDHLGADLGEVRIIRTSPLVDVIDSCCVTG